MGIVSRRNALLGWGVWKLTKEFGKQKAKEGRSGPGDHAGLNKAAPLPRSLRPPAALLWIWRKKSDETRTAR